MVITLNVARLFHLTQKRLPVTEPYGVLSPFLDAEHRATWRWVFRTEVATAEKEALLRQLLADLEGAATRRIQAFCHGTLCPASATLTVFECAACQAGKEGHIPVTDESVLEAWQSAVTKHLALAIPRVKNLLRQASGE